MQMSNQYKVRVPFCFLMHSPISFPLNLQVKRQKKKKAGRGGSFVGKQRLCNMSRPSA